MIWVDLGVDLWVDLGVVWIRSRYECRIRKLPYMTRKMPYITHFLAEKFAYVKKK